MAAFMTIYIDPKTGKEDRNTIRQHSYANVKNVIRFGLVHPVFPAGQYNVYSLPGNGEPKFETDAYKRA